MAALKPEQLTRLKQIAVQTGGRWLLQRPVRSHIEQLYRDTVVAKELTLTEEQLKEFQAVQDVFEKDAVEVLTSAKAFDPTETKLKELAAVLSNEGQHSQGKRREAYDAQRTKLDELIGKPFTGNTQPDRFGGPVNIEERRAAASVRIQN